MDGHGDFDVLVADWKSKQVLLWENRGLNGFRKRVLDNGLSSAHSVYAADLDGDGDMEALASGGGKTVYFRNNGDLNFKKIQVGSRGAFSVFAADIDGDGRKECAGAPDSDGVACVNAGCASPSAPVCEVSLVGSITDCGQYGLCLSSADCASGFGCVALWPDGRKECVPTGGSCDRITDCAERQVCASTRFGGAPNCQAGSVP